MAWVSCPQCKGKAVTSHNMFRLAVIVVLFPAGLLLLLLKRTYRCGPCSFKFKP